MAEMNMADGHELDEVENQKRRRFLTGVTVGFGALDEP